MTRLIALLENMTADERRGALAALDAISRPLTAREIEHLFRDQWVSKSAAVKIATVLAPFQIIAITGAEE